MKTHKGSPSLVAAGLGWGLAAGLALGVLLIAPAMRDAGVAGDAQAAPDAQEADARVDEASAEAAAANEVLAAQAEELVADKLQARSIAVLHTADVPAEEVERLRWLLNTAGAEDAGTITLTDKFTAQDGADELSTIVVNSLPAGAQISVDNIAPGVHAGEAFAAALSINDEGAASASEEDREFLLTALSDAGFVDYEPGSVAAADGVVLLTGARELEPAFRDRLLGDFADAYNSSGSPIVHAVAGQIGEEDLQEGAPQVAYAETEAGRVDTVMTLREELG